MDLKVVLIALTLMTVLCFFSMASSAATPTIDYIHPEDGFYADRRTPLWMDVQALLSFKKHINDPFGKLSNWTTGNSEEACSWYGIVCTHQNPRVVAIILPRLYLTGTLSPSIGSLSLLHTLNLSHHNLSGEIPPEFGQLKALRVLDLSSNHKPIGFTEDLASLRFNSMLTGSIPKSLSNCTSLERLALAYNDFTGSIPAEFGSLIKLELFDLSHNSLTGHIPSSLFGHLDKLQQIDLGSNSLSGHVPPTLENCTMLQSLILNHNRLSGRIPESIFGNSLKIFEVSRNSLGGDMEMRFPVSMLIFSVFSNNFTGSFPSSLANCSKLKVLDLSKNRFVGEIPPFLSYPQLQILSMGYNKFSGGIPRWITNLIKLQILDLSNNKFSGRIPDNEKLQGFAGRIDAYQKKPDLNYGFEIVIKGREYSWVYVVATNVILDLSNNNLTSEIPSSIGSLGQLRLLNLSGNQLEGKIPASLSFIPTLEELDLAKNNLSGEIPQELSKLTMLAYVDFSFNNLCGSIPQGTQFFTFNVSSFQSNKYLCGYPLPSCEENKCLCGSPFPSCNENKTKSMECVKVGWLHYIDERMSLISLGMGAIIGFGGVLIVFIVWKKARDWMVPPNVPKRFYGEYRLPT